MLSLRRVERLVPDAPQQRRARQAGLAVTLFALNRHLEQPMALQVALPGFAMPVPVEALQLRHANLKATNTRDKPNRVSPVPLKGVTAGTDRVQATLAPASWNMIRLAPER